MAPGGGAVAAGHGLVDADHLVAGLHPGHQGGCGGGAVGHLGVVGVGLDQGRIGELVDGEAVAGVGPAHAEGAAPPARALAEQAAEEVADIGEILEAPPAAAIGVGAGPGSLEIAVEMLARALIAGGVDLAPVEAGALVLVAQEVIGGGDGLEPVLGLLVAGVEIGMQLLGELAVGLPDLVQAGVALDAQCLVRVGSHVCSL